MTSKVVLLAGLSVWSIAGVWCGLPVRAQGPAAAWTAGINDVRRVAATIPGRRPSRINVLKFAESRRTKNFSIKGAPAEPSVQARTAFQVMYSDGYVMVYVVLESGREYVLIGDAAWHMDGVRSITGKDAPWVTEDVSAVMDQLKWLHDLSRAEKTLFIVANHDDEQHKELVKKGVLGGKLEIQ